MARTYGEGCPIALSLDILGERWALLVVRELRLGPRRYRDLQEALPGITPAVLSRRLKELAGAGVLRRHRLPPPESAQVYGLTSWGAELEPVFQELARWGIRSPLVPLIGEISADSAMLGMRTFFAADDSAADDRGRRPWTASYEVWLGREPYRLLVNGGRLLELVRGSSTDSHPDVVVRTTKATWLALLVHKESLADVIADGELDLIGDSETLQHLIDASSYRGERLSSDFTSDVLQSGVPAEGL